MKTWTYYAEYQGFTHLMLLLCGWKEHHCLYADGITIIKLTKTERLYEV